MCSLKVGQLRHCGVLENPVLCTQVEPQKSKLIKLWAAKQSLSSGSQGRAADPWMSASQYEVKCSTYRRGPAGCGKHEVTRRGREGGYYGILRLIREGPQ